MLEITSKNISEETLRKYAEEYETMAEQARLAQGYEADLKAALLAPAVFFRDETNLEVALDCVIHHLSEAVNKAERKEDKRAIQRTSEEIFYIYVYSIETRLKRRKEEIKKGFLEKIKSALLGTTNAANSARRHLLTTGAVSGAGLELVFQLVPIALDLIFAYVEKTIREKEIANTEREFYLQMGRSYIKMTNSSCYTGEFSLLRNTFEARKMRAIPYLIHAEGIFAIFKISKIDQSDAEYLSTFRIALSSIARAGKARDTIQLITLVRDHRPHLLPGIRTYAKDCYKGYLARNDDDIKSITMTVAGCALPVMGLILLPSLLVASCYDHAQSELLKQTPTKSADEIAVIFATIAILLLVAIAITLSLKHLFLNVFKLRVIWALRFHPAPFTVDHLEFSSSEASHRVKKLYPEPG